MADAYEPPERRCENCEHARVFEVLVAGDEWEPRLTCESRKPHGTEPHNHCDDWEGADDGTDEA